MSCRRSRAASTGAESSVVMAGHSGPKDGVASLAYVPAIHVFLLGQGVDARDKRGHAGGDWRNLRRKRFSRLLKNSPRSFRDAAKRRARNPDTSEFPAFLDSGLAPIARRRRALTRLWARPGMTFGVFQRPVSGSPG